MKFIKFPKGKKPLLIASAMKSAGSKKPDMTFLENHIDEKQSSWLQSFFRLGR